MPMTNRSNGQPLPLVTGQAVHPRIHRNVIPFQRTVSTVPPEKPPTKGKIRLLNRFELRSILAMFYDHSHSIRYVAKFHKLAESQVENVIRQSTREVAPRVELVGMRRIAA